MAKKLFATVNHSVQSGKKQSDMSSDMDISSSPPLRPSGRLPSLDIKPFDQAFHAASPVKPEVPAIEVQPASSPELPLKRPSFKNFEVPVARVSTQRPVKGLPGRTSPPSMTKPVGQVYIATPGRIEVTVQPSRPHKAKAEGHDPPSLEEPDARKKVKKTKSLDDMLQIGYGRWRKERVLDSFNNAAAVYDPPFTLRKRGGKSDQARFVIGCTGVKTKSCCSFVIKVELYTTNDEKARWRVYEINDVHSDDCIYVNEEEEDKPIRPPERKALSDNRSARNSVVEASPTEADDETSMDVDTNGTRHRRRRSQPDADWEPETRIGTRRVASSSRTKDDPINRDQETIEGLEAILKMNAEKCDTGDITPVARHMLEQGLSPALLTPSNMSRRELTEIMVPTAIHMLKGSAEKAVDGLVENLRLPKKPATPSSDDAEDRLLAAGEHKTMTVFLGALHPILGNARISECLSMLGYTHETLGQQTSSSLGEEIKSQLESMASAETNQTERVLLASRMSSWCKAMKGRA